MRRICGSKWTFNGYFQKSAKQKHQNSNNSSSAAFGFGKKKTRTDSLPRPTARVNMDWGADGGSDTFTPTDQELHI